MATRFDTLEQVLESKEAIPFDPITWEMIAGLPIGNGYRVTSHPFFDRALAIRLKNLPSRETITQRVRTGVELMVMDVAEGGRNDVGPMLGSIPRDNEVKNPYAMTKGTDVRLIVAGGAVLRSITYPT